MYKIGYRDLVNYQKVWFSVEDIAYLQVQRGSNKKKKKLLEKYFTKGSEKWLNNQRINLMNKVTTYHSTHFVMEIVNLVPFVVSWVGNIVLEKSFTKDSEIWLNNPRINLMNNATTYHSTHFVMETVNLFPFVTSWEFGFQRSS